MPLKKLLGAVSPAYGIITGKGEMGRASRKGLFGMLPRMITKDAQDSEGDSGRGMIGRLAGEADQSQTGRPMSDADKKAAAQKFMSGARQMRTSPFGGGKSGIAIPMSGEGMKSGGKLKKYRDGGIYTAEMGKPPQDIDGGSAPAKKPAPKQSMAKKTPAPKKPEAPKKPMVKMAKGGSIDGIAQRGKTDCKMR
jgi:hypothetical protein